MRRRVSQEASIQRDECMADAREQLIQDGNPLTKACCFSELLHGHRECTIEQVVSANLHCLQHQHANDVHDAHALVLEVCVAQGPYDGQALPENEVDQVDHERLLDCGQVAVDEKYCAVSLWSPRLQFFDVGE